MAAPTFLFFVLWNGLIFTAFGVYLQALTDIPPRPDPYFWYVLASVLASALIAIIWRYVYRQDKFNDRIIDVLGGLNIMTALHDKEITEMKKDIEKIHTKIFK